MQVKPVSVPETQPERSERRIIEMPTCIHPLRYANACTHFSAENGVLAWRSPGAGVLPLPDNSITKQHVATLPSRMYKTRSAVADGALSRTHACKFATKEMTYSSLPSIVPPVALHPQRAMCKRRRAHFPTRLPSNLDARAELAAVQHPRNSLSPALPDFKNIARTFGQPLEEPFSSLSLLHIPLFHAFEPPLISFIASKRASRCAQSALRSPARHLASSVRKNTPSAHLSTKAKSIRCRLRICKPRHQLPQTSSRNISFYTHMEEGLKLDKYMFRFLKNASRDVKTCETRHGTNAKKHRSESPSPQTVIAKPLIHSQSSYLRSSFTSTLQSRLGIPTVMALGSYSIYSVDSDSEDSQLHSRL